MIAFFKDQERFKFAFIILGVYFLTMMIWKELFGIFHYIIPFLGLVGTIYTSTTGFISFLFAYSIITFIFKREHRCPFLTVFLSSLILKVLVSIIITFIPFSSFLNYLYPLLMVYLLDYIQLKYKN